MRIALVAAGAIGICGAPRSAAAGPPLTPEEVRRVIAQAGAEALAAGIRAWIAVTDESGNVLGLYRMAGAPERSLVPGMPPVGSINDLRQNQGIEGIPLQAGLAAISKAGAGAFLSSGGNAFSTRTASFIVQEHFPPRVDFTPGGPLFGVQFSSVFCTDFKRPSLPYGLAGDPGGVPLYKGGTVVGGVGVEAGVYGVDTNPATFNDPDDQIEEERAALAGQRGFEAPDAIRADQILADGIRLPYVNTQPRGTGSALPAGDFIVFPGVTAASPTRGGLPSNLEPLTLGGVRGVIDRRFFPFRAGRAGLTAADVTQIVTQAAQQTTRTRAAIRQPLGSFARVSIAVVDTDGSVLGFFQNEDAPNFGIDVAVQKARTANFFSHPAAAAELRAAGMIQYVQDVPLDGSVAFTSRAVGFLAQPFYPPGIPGPLSGPLSVPFDNQEWSPFNTGLQVDLLFEGLRRFVASGIVLSPGQRPMLDLENFLSGQPLPGAPPGCAVSPPGFTPIARLANGITIFPGGVPLYKNGQLVGAIGISGDGVDQDDLISSAGSAGFEAPPERRCDQLVIRGVRLPYVKFPRHPEL